MISWHEVDTISFCEKVTQFLLEHPSPGPKDSTKPLILPEVKNKVITNIVICVEWFLTSNFSLQKKALKLSK